MFNNYYFFFKKIKYFRYFNNYLYLENIEYYIVHIKVMKNNLQFRIYL